MALAETILRKIHKRGIIPKIIKLLPVISIVLAISSIAWLFILPLDGQYRNTYISENALMPAQVTSYFRESEWNIVRGYRSEIKQFDWSQVSENNAKLENWLIDIGLKPLYHENKYGFNTLYSILHAPRGDDTESMVITVPWYTSDDKENIGGISLGIALARYFNKMSIWSKNIIFVFPQDGHASLRLWVEAYHTTLDETAGSIEAALVMEYEGDLDYFSHYSIDYEGLNGQLPNLDLINTVNTIGYHENLHCSIQNTKNNELTKNTYFTRLRTLLRGILQLTLSGLNSKTSGCEAFSGWQIQSITIKAQGTQGSADITQFGRIIDSTIRSINNLLEKFHQSFFFYLLLSSKNFVSIGTYLPSAILMAASFSVSALSCLLNNKIKATEYINNISKLLIIFTTIEITCFLLSIILPNLLHLNTEELSIVKIILIALTGVSLIISSLPMLSVSSSFNFKLNKSISYSIMSLSLFIISMLIITLLIVHFSLALSIGLITLPLTFIPSLINSTINNPSLKVKNNFKISLCLILSNPIFIIYIIGELYYADESNGIIQLMRGLLTSWYELQCWTWFVIMLGWLPSWIGVSLSCIWGDYTSDAEIVKKNQ